ncbi:MULTISPECIES: DUF4328 domain-containing protein [Nocardiaceae]|uniref:DUF4328 domain-containing protein n=1 Tax=Rhodococcoides kroppenstedtii TaxID=293050 RepID=A0ABS7NXL4_9NOCA|nr:MULTISPECIES: DUF4328 domain-containing protein [Rhodococcus]AMY21031.1 hypothetical protein A3Q40_03680 [Rhodococcus sp. PBTS 1]MBY6315186.1 DUF4328 domain-containing protein [Rhodococcus kroppenstedtii]MBY6322790.1 DUF4328 domain-containing protein [Rhodococcus kroppenstedtii]MBY6401513.1 DUF4328 domain-containing protein [Rhodococcus kroppenstedtii]
MIYFQICARCRHRIDVGARPLQWCPLCRGVLLSPIPVGAPPGAVRRNFRWVATRPGGRRPILRVAPPGPTPSYAEIPRWGLPTEVPPPVEVPDRADRLAGRAPRLLAAAVVLFAAAALAEFGRYGVLLVNRERLIAPAVLALSDAAVWCLAVIGTGVGIAAAVASVAWLRRARSDAYAAVGAADPRRLRTLYAGSLIPLVNLVMPGIFLTELARVSRHGPRVTPVVPWWWTVWIANWAMLAIATAFRFGDGIQAQANGVVAAALTDVVAAGLAAITLVVMRRAEDRTTRGDRRVPTRWVLATGDAERTEKAEAVR